MLKEYYYFYFCHSDLNPASVGVEPVTFQA